MIPWVREKFAERRARWIASRKANEPASTSNSQNCNLLVSNTEANCSQKAVETLNSSSKKGSEDVRSSNTPGTSAKENQRRVKILNPQGNMVALQVDIQTKIVELKERAIRHFSADESSLAFFSQNPRELFSRYRLIRPDSVDYLNENLSLIQAEVYENELFMLNIKRTNHHDEEGASSRGPSAHEILLATRNLRTTTIKPPRVDINEIVLQSDLQFDVRKVLISLAQASAFVIGCGPYAPRLLSMLKQKLINKRKHQNDSLQCLVDMGFTKEMAVHALNIKKMEYSAALEWLIEHENEKSLCMRDENDASSPSTSIASSSTLQSCENNFMENVEALLEIVRIYGQREISPPPETVHALVAMGFEETAVHQALSVTRNNQAAACEWLCGNRSSSLTELREGLSPESPILKAMMDSPQVQISLGNPKILIAYLSMLDNQNALSMWLGDSDTSSVLSHILRKYHEEKHILGINQFNSVR